VTLLVGTFGARSVESLLAHLGSTAARACDVVELRLDFLPGAAERLPEILRACPRPAMATCRRAGEGGAFAGDERARLDVLARAADAGAAWVDVEDDVATADAARLAGRGAKLVRSLHVPALPERADETVDRLLRAPADAAKLVPLRGSAADVLRLLDLVARRGERLGAHVSDSPFSRYAGAATGSAFTYASLAPGGLIPAPIPTVRTTVVRNRFRRLAAGAPLFVLLGGDVEASISPDMLNAAFEGLGLPHVALRWSCDDPAPALDALERFGWAGAAVTIPHKERVLELLRRRGARLAPSAEETGAVNTVLRDDEGLVGHNTDVRGIVDAVRPFTTAQPVAGRAALVLGAGGAARAGVRAALALGASEVVVHARRAEEAGRLAALRRDGEPPVRAAATPAEAAACLPALVLQATPAGGPGGAPFFDLASLTRRALVQEMIVSPVFTENHRVALGAGHRVADGFHMLLHQAREQVRLAAGRPPDFYAMRDAGSAALHVAARKVFLVGLRCTGKTETGARVARLLRIPFVDIDREVEEATGRAPDEMIRSGEEARFRAAEGDALRRVAFSRAASVVATGGGAALHGTTLRSIAKLWPVVLLDAADEVLLARWTATPRAPLTSLEPAAELARQRTERGPLYAELAWLTVDTSSRSPDDAAEAVAAVADREWSGGKLE
jgi:3-dehydroquinate dehydratase / shikimate dehydrogenase